jgi:uncharacterized protein YyaL (SSP411 family)
MSVFLTPDLRPFYGGTYFPPQDMYGRPGFPTVLRGVEEAYRNRPEDVERVAGQFVDILRQLAEPRAPEAPVTINDEFIDELVDRSTADYEPSYGGFGSAPKFPRQTLLELLLVYLLDRPEDESKIKNQKSKIQNMLRHSLDAMARGGIRDHLGGGFHRYSTDGKWLVPHFEIMLYDNAMLGYVYAEASRQFDEPRYGAIARGVFDFVLREMTSPGGAFYTAFDAEVDAQEGLSYLWTADEIGAVLGAEDAASFNKSYGLDRGPNFADPHHGSGSPDKNVLYLPEPLADNADARLEPLRQKLYAVRRQRKQPLLDTKVITSWNALMIRALALAGRVLSEPRYTAAAGRAAEFLLAHHIRADTALWRTSRDGVKKHDAFLDDYAFLTQALLELHTATGDGIWRERAGAVHSAMLARFHDKNRGGFYFTAEAARDLIVRQKVASDSPLPSGNAVAAMCALELGHSDVARDTLALFAGQLESQGEGMSSMLQAAIGYLRKEEPITVSPGPWRGGQPPDVQPPSPREQAASVVSFNAVWATPAQLNVHLEIAPGYHINAHEAGPDLIPTRLSISSTGGDVQATTHYPPGDLQTFPFSSEPMRVYAGRTSFVVRFQKPVTDTLHLSLTCQPCTDQACLSPITKSTQVTPPK